MRNSAKLQRDPWVRKMLGFEYNEHIYKVFRWYHSYHDVICEPADEPNEAKILNQHTFLMPYVVNVSFSPLFNNSEEKSHLKCIKSRKLPQEREKKHFIQN